MFSTIGCGAKDEITSLSTLRDSKKVWVFAQFNINDENGMDSYYYYGEISKNLYETIATNNIQTGFILLENVKYWGEDDIIYDYKDEEDSGELIFRIEDIVKVDLLNKAPVTGKSTEQTEEQDDEAVNLEKSESKVKNVIYKDSNG